MAIPKRRARIAGTYFITSQTWEGRAIFTKENACEIFMRTLSHYRDWGAYLLHAFVLMPDHFHLLLTPCEDVSLERAIQYIKGGSAHDLGMRFPVWQRGFSDHRIRDLRDYEFHLRYIEMNPVKGHLAATPGGYPWSSAAHQVPLDERPSAAKAAV